MINFRFKNTYFFSVILMLLLLISCANKQTSKSSENKNVIISEEVQTAQPIIVGADRVSTYISLIKNKNIAVVANQTSVINVLERRSRGNSTMESEMIQYHLVDYLNANYNIKIKKVFSPEHGFRGKADAGEKVTDGKDLKTGLPIVSLYGKNKKPTQDQLEGLDAIVFDIQDVGARFYTYISTLHYVMEAAAEKGIPVIVLDRPNPNGHYIDGPVLEMEHKSFVGMHPVPVVYGMTIGEYAQMINGENWLENNLKCDLTVIPLKNYTHNSKVHLAIKPSPNLPNDKSINLYPSLCFFEGTNVSVGRGTDKQFQVFGSPFLNTEMFPYTYQFTPKPNEGSKNPKYNGKLCNGMDLSNSPFLNRLDLNYIINAYEATENKNVFFNSFFTKLAGTKKLQAQIESKHTAYEIKKNWVRDLDAFKKVREQYLIYQ